MLHAQLDLKGIEAAQKAFQEDMAAVDQEAREEQARQSFAAPASSGVRRPHVHDLNARSAPRSPRRNTMSMNVNGGAVTRSNIQGMDLETALLAVQSQRANHLLEDQLKGQIEAVQKKNAQIAQLNTAMAALNGVKGLYGGESKATMSDTQNKKNGNNTLEKVQQAQNNANNALKAAGYEGA